MDTHRRQQHHLNMGGRASATTSNGGLPDINRSEERGVHTYNMVVVARPKQWEGRWKGEGGEGRSRVQVGT
jgi:hypothetical protein